MKFLNLIIISFIVFFSISCNTTSADDYVFEGKKKLQKQDLKGALEFFDKALEIKPDFADAYLQRGRTKFNLKDADGAIADLSNALKFNDTLAEAYYNRATVYVYKGDMNNACEDFRKAKELNYPNIDDSFRMCNEK